MMKGRLLLAFSIVLLVLSFLPIHLLHPPSIFIAGNYDLSPGNVNGPSTFLPFLSVSVLAFFSYLLLSDFSLFNVFGDYSL